MSIESLQNGNPPCDIIELRAGERITYRKCTGTKRRTRSLKSYRNLLGMPKAKTLIWEIDIYKDLA